MQWILGSQAFADRLRNLLPGRETPRDVPQERNLRGMDVTLMWEAVLAHYGANPDALSARGRHTEMRSVAAWLAKRHIQATLWELAAPLGLGRPQSVGNLTKRVDTALRKSRKLRRTIVRRTIATIEATMTDRLAKRTKPRRRKKKK